TLVSAGRNATIQAARNELPGDTPARMGMGMPEKIQFSQRRSERGQTIVLVAISIVSLLAMAALAIDVVTLYVARSEIQRAADAAALAGAKAMADSGVTSIPTTDPHYTDNSAQSLASAMATTAITAVVQNSQ